MDGLPLSAEDLLARAAIHDTLKRYARGVDRADAELMRACYHPDATDDHGAFVGSADAFVDFVTGTRARRYVSTTHFLGSPLVVREGQRAAVETPCIAHQVTRPDEAGRTYGVVVGLRYLDKFERRTGSPWLIAHRVAVFDWTYTVPVDEALIRPFDERSHLGTRDGDDPSYRYLGQLEVDGQ